VSLLHESPELLVSLVDFSESSFDLLSSELDPDSSVGLTGVALGSPSGSN
jgi:hypothetical protein